MSAKSKGISEFSWQKKVYGLEWRLATNSDWFFSLADWRRRTLLAFWRSWTSHSFLKRWMFVSAILHITATIFSVGFYQYDEHFSVLEFMNYFLGGADANALPWEFPTEMRSWVQPLFYACVVKALYLIGISNPMDCALVLRLFSAALGWISLILLGRCCEFWIENQSLKQWSIRGLALTWFIPFIHARTSAENLSGSLFWIAIGCFSLASYGDHKKPLKTDLKYVSPRRAWGTWLLCGLLFGLAFMVRFQIAFLLVGFLLWLLFVARVPKKLIFGMSLGFVLGVSLGIGCDRIGYGHFSLTFWNYFNIHIIHKVSASANREPLWQYFSWAILYLPPLSAVLLFGSLMGLYRGGRPTSHNQFWSSSEQRLLLTWCMTPFLIAHCLIPNKELRFLFPILSAVPILCAFGFDSYCNLNFSFKFRRFWKIALYILLTENIIMLCFVCLRPACSAVPFYDYLYRNFPNPNFPKELTFYSSNGDPFIMLDNLKLNFYAPKHYAWKWRASLGEIEQIMLSSSEPILLYHHGLELPSDFPHLQAGCKELYRTLPHWVGYVNFNNWLSRSRPWSLYQCEHSGQKLSESS